MAKAYRLGMMCGHDAWTWSVWSETRPSGEGSTRHLARDAEGAPEAEGLELLKRTADGATGLVVALPTERVLLRIERYPATSADDIAAMVGLRADAISPFPLDQVVHGWEVLEQGDDDTLVLIAVCKVAEVIALAGPIRDAVGPIARVDVAALAWWHLLQAGGHIAATGREVVAVVGESAMELMIHDGGQLLAVASLGLDAGTLETLAEDSAWEITHLLRGLGLEFGAAPVTLSVWGGDVELVDALRERTGLPLESSSLAVVSGSLTDAVAWRDAMRVGALDLVPPAWREVEGRNRFRRRLIRSVVSVVAVWLVLVGGVFGWRAWRAHQVRLLAAEHATWAAPASDVLQIRRRLGMIRRYMDRHDSALEALLGVVSSMPDTGMELLSFTYRKNDVVIVEGLADNGQLRLAFMEALNGSDLFRRVESGQSSIVKNRERFKLELYFTEAQP